MTAFANFSTPDLKIIRTGLELAERRSRVIAQTTPKENEDDLAMVNEALRFASEALKLREALNNEFEIRQRNEQA
jgi:hypothetical protein